MRRPRAWQHRVLRTSPMLPTTIPRNHRDTRPFLTLAVMPFTYSITNGIGAGFLAFVVLRLLAGRIREVHPLMLGAAAALLAAGALSSLVTPAAGEIYAGKLITAGMGIRLVSLGVAYLGAVELTSCSFPLVEAGGCNGIAGSGIALFILGGLGFGGGIAYDIATAGRAVDDYNQRLHLRVTPTVIPTASSGPAVGLGITGSF